MKQHLLSVVVAGFCGLLLSEEAQAQYYPYQPGLQRPIYSPYSRPGLNPYMNLLRGGNPAANYYLGVLPELDRRSTDFQYRSAILDLDRRFSGLGDTSDMLQTLPGTGHPVGFLNYGGYYNLGGMTRMGLPQTALTPPPRRGR